MGQVKLVIELDKGQLHAVYANCDISYILVEPDNAVVGHAPVTGVFAADEIIDDPRLLYTDTDLWDKIKDISFDDTPADAPEYISLEDGIPEAWVCLCGNTPDNGGFYACNQDGELIEPTDKAGWKTLYRCESCGRIVDQDNLAVKGQWKGMHADTPLAAFVNQYFELKRQHPKKILLVQKHDAYMAYGNDTQKIATVLGMDIEDDAPEIPLTLSIAASYLDTALRELANKGHQVHIKQIEK